jgi:hypothetical protein
MAAIGHTSEALSDIVSGMAEAVPILSTAWKAIGVIYGIWEASQATAQYNMAKARGRAYDDKQKKCVAALNSGEVRRTIPGGPSPADLFRKIAQWGPGHELPYNLGSVYLIMCAPETQGFGPSRAEYEDFVRRKGIHHTIPKHVKRQAWSLIKGIMGSIIDPRMTLEVQKSPGDEGLSLMPMLQEIFRQTGPEAKNQWNQQTVRAFYDRWVIPRRQGVGSYEGARYETDLGSCSPYARKDYAKSFYDSLIEWNSHLRTVLLPDYEKKVAEQRRKTKQAIIALGRASVMNLTEEGIASREAAAKKKLASEEARRGSAVKAAAWSTAVLLGGGGFMMARRAAKKGR